MNFNQGKDLISEEWFTPDDLKYIGEPFNEYDIEYIRQINRPAYWY